MIIHNFLASEEPFPENKSSWCYWIPEALDASSLCWIHAVTEVSDFRSQFALMVLLPADALEV